MAVVENRGPELFVVCVVLLCASVVVSLLRVYTRLGVVKAWGLDDWTMSFAAVSPSVKCLLEYILTLEIQISFILFVTSALTGIHYGTGRHDADLTTPNIQQAMKVSKRHDD